MRVQRPPASAANHLQNARAYFLAAEKVLGDHEQVAEDLIPAFWFLVSFSIELALKAIALEKGVPQATVEGWQHRLQDAYDGVLALGLLPATDNDLLALVRAIGASHEQLHFRYTPADLDEIIVPPAHLALDALEVLIRITVLTVLKV